MGFNPFKVAEKALGVAADVATGGAYSSYKAQRNARKAQKEQQRKEQEAIKKKKKQLLRKERIK